MRNNSVKAYANENSEYMPTAIVNCNWQVFRAQIMQQWKRLTPKEVDQAGPDYRRLARLIERKYGIASVMIENYLRNFERTLPLKI